MALRWYVVQAYSGYEKTVKLSLEDRIARSRGELKKCFGQYQHLNEDGETEYLGPVLVPTEEVVEMRAGQKRRSERRLFLVMFLSKWIWIPWIPKSMIPMVIPCL